MSIYIYTPRATNGTQGKPTSVSLSSLSLSFHIILIVSLSLLATIGKYRHSTRKGGQYFRETAGGRAPHMGLSCSRQPCLANPHGYKELRVPNFSIYNPPLDFAGPYAVFFRNMWLMDPKFPSCLMIRISPVLLGMQARGKWRLRRKGCGEIFGNFFL